MSEIAATVSAAGRLVTALCAQEPFRYAINVNSPIGERTFAPVDNVKIRIVDKGALDCTIKARIEGAVYRSVDQYDNLPWGGAIR